MRGVLYAASDGPVARSLGVLAAACGDAQQAAAHFQHALDLCGSAGVAAFEARARADLARRPSPDPQWLT
jgi:hypothetical protein